MKAQIYQLLHVISMILLVAYTFQAFANPDPKERKRILMITGILTLLMAIGGFGLLAVMQIGFPLWIIVKVTCWLGLSAVAGVAFRRPAKIPTLRWVTIAFVVAAVASVYFKFGQGPLE